MEREFKVWDKIQFKYRSSEERGREQWSDLAWKTYEISTKDDISMYKWKSSLLPYNNRYSVNVFPDDVIFLTDEAKNEVKFKIGDRVRYVGNKEWKICSIDEIWKEYTIRKPFDDYCCIEEKFLFLSYYNLELITDKASSLTDYTKTYVRINCKDEYDIALKFYKEKTWLRASDSWYFNYARFISPWNNHKWITSDHVDTISAYTDDCNMNDRRIDWWYKDITSGVLWSDTKLLIASEEPKLRWVNCSTGWMTFDDDWAAGDYRPKWQQEKLSKAPLGQDPTFNINKPTKMNKVRATIRDRFFKKNETKVIDLIENVETNLERLTKVINFFDDLDTDITDVIKLIEGNIEYNNKEGLSKNFKKLQDFDKELSDNLLEQFIIIGEKILSAKKK